MPNGNVLHEDAARRPVFLAAARYHAILALARQAATTVAASPHLSTPLAPEDAAFLSDLEGWSKSTLTFF